MPDKQYSKDSIPSKETPPIRIRVKPRPLPADYSSRLAKIYALAVQWLEEHEAAQKREGSDK